MPTYYTYGVRRKFLPFYKKYKVISHANETIDQRTRLVLTAADESVIVIPDVSKKYLKLYPDFSEFKKMVDKIKAKTKEENTSA